MLKQVKPGLFAVHWPNGDKMPLDTAANYFECLRLAFCLVKHK